jgi:hypothetical protein
MSRSTKPVSRWALARSAARSPKRSTRESRGPRARCGTGVPVWFIDGNPIVGYWVRKAYMQLLFWSGQSFEEPGLRPEGKFKAAELRITDAAQLKARDLMRWLRKSRSIQWDDKNIVKRRGVARKDRRLGSDAQAATVEGCSPSSSPWRARRPACRGSGSSASAGRRRPRPALRRRPP